IGDDPARLGRFSDAPTRIQGAKDSLAGSVTDPRALTLLVATLGTDNPCVRRVAAKLLGRSAGSAAVRRELLADASPRVRESAAFAAGVGERRDTRAALEHLLADTAAGPAAMAAWALGEMHDPASAQALRGAVQASSPPVPLPPPWPPAHPDAPSLPHAVLPLLRHPAPAMRATAPPPPARPTRPPVRAPPPP